MDMVMKKMMFLSLLLVSASFQAHSSNDGTSYAALSMDKLNGFYYGWSHDYPTRSDAADKAKSECKKAGGKNCSVVLEFSGNGYGYYYTVSGKDGSAYGWAAYQKKEDAQQRALNECTQRANGKPCDNFVWASNSGTKEQFELISNSSKGLCYGIVVQNCGTEKSKSFRTSNNLPYGVRAWTRPFTFKVPICYNTKMYVKNGKLEEDGSRSLKKEPEIVSAVIALEKELTKIIKRDAPRICNKRELTMMKTWVSEEGMRESMGYENSKPAPGNRGGRLYKEVSVPIAVDYIDLKLNDGLQWD
ncbi:hypothetical protein C9J47_02455 [Photobacterium indicum]|uniref:DUF4189 domain-containing protein n=2 Tax=Photobacterium indicum TaxID=81447 RepID=A0A2T3LDK7_9GAMM|nr:hypothetical protein C9J47_02455 [Photobacterium indicum]